MRLCLNRSQKSFFFVIPAREVFFQPDVEADEEVAGAHFADLKFGYTLAAVSPSDGDGGE